MAVKLQMFGGETCHVHVKVDHAGQGNNRQGIRSLSSFSLESKYKEFGSSSLWRTLVPTCLKCNWQYFRREKESLIQIGLLGSWLAILFQFSKELNVFADNLVRALFIHILYFLIKYLCYKNLNEKNYYTRNFVLSPFLHKLWPDN